MKLAAFSNILEFLKALLICLNQREVSRSLLRQEIVSK